MSASTHGDLKKTWQINTWANGQTIDRKIAVDQVMKVLKSFGHKEHDIDREALGER